MDVSVLMSKLAQMWRMFLSNGWYPIIVGVIVMVFALFSMSQRQSSAGSWFFVLLAAVLFIYGLGQLTGLGFSMSF